MNHIYEISALPFRSGATHDFQSRSLSFSLPSAGARSIRAGAESSVLGMVQQRQLAELLHGKLSSRSRLIAVTLTPFSVFYLMVRTGVAFQSTSTSVLQIIAVSSPYLLTALIAAAVPEGVPQGLPLTSCRHMAALCLVMMVSDAKNAYDALHTVEFALEVRIVRASTTATFALLMVPVAFDILQHRARHWWTCIRVLIGVGSLVRLGSVVLLRTLGGPEDCYLPIRSSFASSLGFSIASLIFAAFGLSLTARRRFSEWSGLYSVVFTLADLHSLPDAPRGTAPRHVTPSGRCSDVSSEASRLNRARACAKPVRVGSVASVSSSNSKKSIRGDGSSKYSPRRGDGADPSRRRAADAHVASGSSVLAPGAIERDNAALLASGSLGAIHRSEARARRIIGRRVTLYPEDFERMGMMTDGLGTSGMLRGRRNSSWQR